jgi:hypothetical protein
MVEPGLNIPQNLIPNEPELKDLFALFSKDLMLKLNCHAIGTIQSFDPAEQTAAATVNYRKTFKLPNEQGVYGLTTVPYPQLVDCPVIFLGGGGASLTFPVAQGDECLVLFNDRDLDNWFQGNLNAPPATPRLHSFSDAIIMVGLRSRPNVVQSFNSDNMQIKTGTLTVTFRKEGGVVIQNDIGNFIFEDNADVTFDTGTVQGLFGNGGHVKFQNATGELIDAIITLFTTATAGGFPLVVNPTALAALQSFKEP